LSGGRRTVLANAHHLAEVIVQALCAVAIVAIAQSDEQGAIGCEAEAGAVVQRARHRRLLAEDHLHLRQRRRLQHSPADRRA
jgi:hypothetical protein